MPNAPFHKVLVANRGAVAARVIRALRTLAVRSVAVYSEADADAPYLEEADERYCIGPAAARESYLNPAKLLDVMRACRADGVHPGYGFLAENAAFARAVDAIGVRFIGPGADWIGAMGEKTRARQLMSRHGLPVASGSGILGNDLEAIREQARAIGYPVLVKPAGGGGGIGMQVAADEAGLERAVASARSLAERSFSNGDVYLEKLIEEPRHIEFQVIGDRSGAVAHLFERDCSMQRRHQKVIEEASAPNLPVAELDALAERLCQALRAMRYDNIGTVEMLRGRDGAFGFLEMNTRLQVEHAVTEELTGTDLVAAQIRSAAGESLENILPGSVRRRGHAIEARVYAEDPRTFYPSPGRLVRFQPPAMHGVRVECGYAEGNQITPYYDPMIAKVIATAATRVAAIDRLHEALSGFEIAGVKTNIPFILFALRSPEFVEGRVHTGLVPELAARFRSAAGAAREVALNG